MVLYRVLIIFDNLTSNTRKFTISWQTNDYSESIDGHKSGTSRSVTNPITYSSKLVEYVTSNSLGVLCTAGGATTNKTTVNIFNTRNSSVSNQTFRILTIGYIN